MKWNNPLPSIDLDETWQDFVDANKKLIKGGKEVVKGGLIGPLPYIYDEVIEEPLEDVKDIGQGILIAGGLAVLYLLLK